MLLPARPLMLAFLTALAVASTPAHAGRASACKAPPFAVPKETQRAVDAAIEARVVGTGAGAVSTAVETRTDYETTTLSQDAVARAWTEYTLCLKLAKKLISQDLHDDLLRGLLAPPPMQSTPLDPPGAAPQPVDTNPEAAPVRGNDLVGTWQVTAVFGWSTCPAPNDHGGANSYQWLLSYDARDNLVVEVVGTTVYPRMIGEVRDDLVILNADYQPTSGQAYDLLLNGVADSRAFYLAQANVILRAEAGALVGSRDVVHLMSPRKEPNASGGTDFVYESCMVHFDVRATR